VDLGGGSDQRVRRKNWGERRKKHREEETEAAKGGAGRGRSQTQEKGLARENSVAANATGCAVFSVR
jgi:hypothetical protein